METTKLKRFACFARRSLRQQVTEKLEAVLFEESAARRESAEAVRNLELIAVIRDAVHCFEGDNYQQQFSQLAAWSETPAIGDAALKNEGNQATQAENKVEYVPSYSVQVPFDKAWLANESDVEHYLKSMREALLKEIRKGKRIQI